MKNKQNFCFTKSKAYGLCGVVITISLFSTTQVNADETTSGTKPRTEQIVSVVSETPKQEEVKDPGKDINTISDNDEVPKNENLNSAIEIYDQTDSDTTQSNTETVENEEKYTAVYDKQEEIKKVAENDKQKEISLTPYIKSVSQMTRPTSTELKITHTVTNTSSLTILSSNWYVPFATISKTDLTPLKWSNERLGFLYPDNTSKVPEGSLLKIVDSTNSLNTNLLEYVERGNNEGLLYNAKPEIINLSTDKVARINIGRLNPGETVILSYTFCITDPTGDLINNFAYNIASYKYGVVKAANITANYVDEQGNTISDNVVLNGNVGDTYTTEQKAIAGYTFKAVQGITTGTFTEAEQAVTYLYTKDPVAGASITAKYVDEQGNTISDNVVLNGNVGDTYTTEQKAIAGYTFKAVQGITTGTFTEAEQAVTYLYTKDPVAGASITAKYVDEQGNTISDNVVLNGNVGDTYTTEQKAIAGYTFRAVQGNATGTFTNQPQTVTYVYMKNNVTPSPKPDDHSDTPESSKDNGNKNASTSENKNTLPQTGENEGLSIIGMISGLLLILGTTVLIIFKRKKQD